MIFHCLLAVISLCGALRDRPVLALTAAHAAVASWDWTVTREGVNAGAHEADPLARPFVHSNATMALGEVLEVSLTAMVVPDGGVVTRRDEDATHIMECVRGGEGSERRSYANSPAPNTPAENRWY